METLHRPRDDRRSRIRHGAALALLAAALLFLSGCGPEAARVRGGDKGAQVGFDAPTDVDLLGDTDRDERIYETVE